MKTRMSMGLLIAALALPLAPSLMADATEPERRIVTVTGQETVRIPATRARLTAMVETQAESPAAAQAEVRKGSQSVLEFLQRSKVDRLQAGAMTLYPVYGEQQPHPTRGPGPEPKIVGYRAQWNASFEVEASRAGEIADGMVEAGIARIANFTFTAADEELAKAQQEALRRAATRARGDAQAVLEALGYTPGDVLKVHLNTGGPQPFFRRGEMMAMAADGGAPTAVAPGMIDVEGSVTLEVGY